MNEHNEHVERAATEAAILLSAGCKSAVCPSCFSYSVALIVIRWYARARNEKGLSKIITSATEQLEILKSTRESG